jgi:hypothetical protein
MCQILAANINVLPSYGKLAIQQYMRIYSTQHLNNVVCKIRERIWEIRALHLSTHPHTSFKAHHLPIVNMLLLSTTQARCLSEITFLNSSSAQALAFNIFSVSEV